MAKRKRSFGVMGVWRELAATAPGTLLIVALDTTSGLLGTVDSAHRMLGTADQTLRMLRAGATSGDIGSATDGQFGGAFPSALLDGALSELIRLRALHLRAGYAYNLYARARSQALGDGEERPRPDPLVVASWHRHRHDALVHAMGAKRKLSSAASIARAAEDAVRVFRSFPRSSPDWTAWTSAALRFAFHAGVSAALALRALRRMRDAVALEFYDAWRVFNL